MNKPGKIYGTVEQRELISRFNQLVDYVETLRVQNSATMRVESRSPGGTKLTVIGVGEGGGGQTLDAVWS